MSESCSDPLELCGKNESFAWQLHLLEPKASQNILKSNESCKYTSRNTLIRKRAEINR